MSETRTNADPRAQAEAEATAESRMDGPETTDQADAAPAGAPDAASRMAKLEAEVANLKDQLLRAMAETENVRRRAEREREDTAKYAIAKFAKDLLAVADNLRRAVESVKDETRQSNEAVDSLLTGVEATERQLSAAFERAGIQKMDPTEKPADPNFHQIMMEIEGTGRPPGVVVQVLQSGYTLQGRLLREAMVAVSKGGDASGHVNTEA